eukprot:gene17573-biopygen14416
MTSIDASIDQSIDRCLDRSIDHWMDPWIGWSWAGLSCIGSGWVWLGRVALREEESGVIVIQYNKNPRFRCHGGLRGGPWGTSKLCACGARGMHGMDCVCSAVYLDFYLSQAHGDPLARPSPACPAARSAAAVAAAAAAAVAAAAWSSSAAKPSPAPPASIAQREGAGALAPPPPPPAGRAAAAPVATRGPQAPRPPRPRGVTPTGVRPCHGACRVLAQSPGIFSPGGLAEPILGEANGLTWTCWAGRAEAVGGHKRCRAAPRAPRTGDAGHAVEYRSARGPRARSRALRAQEGTPARGTRTAEVSRCMRRSRCGRPVHCGWRPPPPPPPPSVGGGVVVPRLLPSTA